MTAVNLEEVAEDEQQPKLQLIDGDSAITDSNSFDAFLTTAGLQAADAYAVVSIMGPQSSGKSTVMNMLFGTPFAVMDGSRGRGQTTKGIWVSKAPELPLLVLDLQGTDSIEGGDDSRKFERQSSLFALALSDVLLVNVWFHDLGRHDASNMSLLRTVMEVHLQLFGSAERPVRTVLLFLIRDHIEQACPTHSSVSLLSLASPRALPRRNDYTRSLAMKHTKTQSTHRA